jgi:hypothetical protein
MEAWNSCFAEFTKLPEMAWSVGKNGKMRSVYLYLKESCEEPAKFQSMIIN